MSKGYTAQSLKQTLYKLGKGYSKIAQAIAQTRYVYSFNGVDNCIEFDAALTINVGDVISFKSSKPSADLATVIDSVGRFFRIRYTASNGTISIVNLVGTVNGQPITNGVTLWPDGVSEFVLTSQVTDNLLRLGALSDSYRFFFDGLIYDFKINDGSVYNYPINDRTFGVGAVIANTATVLGAELFVNPTISSYWTDNGDGSYTINAPDGAFNSLSVPPTGLVNGDTILIQFEVVSISGVDSVSAHSSGQQVRSNGNTGTFKGLITHNGIGGLHFARGSGSGAFTSTIRNISIKKANGYATGVNLLESGWTEINI